MQGKGSVYDAVYHKGRKQREHTAMAASVTEAGGNIQGLPRGCNLERMDTPWVLDSVLVCNEAHHVNKRRNRGV